MTGDHTTSPSPAEQPPEQPPDRPPGPVAHDRHWAGEVRGAVRCAGFLIALLLLIDTAAGELTAPRAALWAGLSVLLFVVLVPPRVSAGEGWLEARGLSGRRRVRTDRLVSVRWLDGVSRRIVLRDEDGRRVQLDPQVLVANPDLWARLERGARTSVERSLLTCGATALRQLSRQVDGETTRLLFQVSGLESK